MSQPFHPTIPPSRADQIQEAWIANVRAIIQRDGHAVRGGKHALVIELQHPNRPDVWQPLNLQTNTCYFATAEDRDAVLQQLWRAPS